MPDGMHDLALRRAGKWRPASKHLIENSSQAPQVCAEIDALSRRLLGRHIERGSLCGPIQSYRGLTRFCQAKVDDPGDAVLCHDDVARLNVAMKNAAFMSLRQPRCNLPRDLQSFGNRQTRAGLIELAPRNPVL